MGDTYLLHVEGVGLLAVVVPLAANTEEMQDGRVFVLHSDGFVNQKCFHIVESLLAVKATMSHVDNSEVDMRECKECKWMFR